jgi:hypothetical protein
MLHILNKRRNPFPHLKGKGGLYYHPSRHMIGGQSIIKPFERVPFYNAKIIGGMIGGEENQLVVSNGPAEEPEEEVEEEQPSEEETQPDEDEESRDFLPIENISTIIDIVSTVIDSYNDPNSAYSRGELTKQLTNLISNKLITNKEDIENINNWKKLSVNKSKEKDTSLLKTVLNEYTKSKRKLEKVKANHEKIEEKSPNSIVKNYYKTKFEEMEESHEQINSIQKDILDNFKKLLKDQSFSKEQYVNAGENKKSVEYVLYKLNQQTLKDYINESIPTYYNFLLQVYSLYTVSSDKIKNDILKEYPKMDIPLINKSIFDNLDLYKKMAKDSVEFTITKLNEFEKMFSPYYKYITKHNINVPKNIEIMQRQLDTILKITKEGILEDLKEKQDARLKASSELIGEEVKKEKDENIIKSKKTKKEEKQKLRDYSSSLYAKYLEYFPERIDEDMQASTDGIIPSFKLTEMENAIDAKKAEKAKPKQDEESIPKDMSDVIEGYIKNFNSRRTGNTKYDLINEYELMKNNGMIDEKTWSKIVKKDKELKQKFNEKNKYKALTGKQTEMAIKKSGSSYGSAFEELMITGDGKNFLYIITDSISEIYPTDLSPNIADGIVVGKDSLGRPLTLRQSCVIDAFNDVACFEFKARIKKKGDESLSYKSVSHIGLTTTKLSQNVSFKLLFSKEGGKFKISNVEITDERNIIKGKFVDQLFTNDVSKDYYGIFMLKEGVYYYDILDDMTDDPKLFKDGIKNILVKNILGTYQFQACNYNIEKGQMGLEYQIPKEKFHPIVPKKKSSKKKSSKKEMIV